MTTTNDLNDRQILVTGASRGIGKAVCLCLAALGAEIIAVARTRAKLKELVEEMPGGPHHVFALDVCDAPAWNALEGLIATRGLHGVVTAAAQVTPIGPIRSIEIEDFRATIDVNVVGTFVAIKKCLPFLRAPGSSIVTFSGGGGTAPLPRFDAYAASKAAVVRLTENVAIDLRDSGIRVNAVAPGFVASEMHSATLDAGPEVVGAEYFDRTRRAVKDGEADPPELAAELVAFLLSDRSAGITGKLISARWDPFNDASFLDTLRTDADFGTVRRIDRQKFFSHVDEE